uniref:Uncharacterized protein n=1 Tax=Rhizophora mucronata TaxID=61149 RepID=A0A2P2JZN6_RHIMU
MTPSYARSLVQKPKTNQKKKKKITNPRIRSSRARTLDHDLLGREISKRSIKRQPKAPHSHKTGQERRKRVELRDPKLFSHHAEKNVYKKEKKKEQIGGIPIRR